MILASFCLVTCDLKKENLLSTQLPGICHSKSHSHMYNRIIETDIYKEKKKPKQNRKHQFGKWEWDNTKAISLYHLGAVYRNSLTGPWFFSMGKIPLLFVLRSSLCSSAQPRSLTSMVLSVLDIADIQLVHIWYLVGCFKIQIICFSLVFLLFYYDLSFLWKCDSIKNYRAHPALFIFVSSMW